MRLLVCGLNPVVANVLEFRIRRYGYFLHRTDNINDALHLIHNTRIDAVILNTDFVAYQISTFISLIRQDLNVTLPIILFAEADTDLNIIEEGIEAGADDFLIFPFKPAELILRLKLLLHQPAKQQRDYF